MSKQMIVYQTNCFIPILLIIIFVMLFSTTIVCIYSSVVRNGSTSSVNGFMFR